MSLDSMSRAFLSKPKPTRISRTIVLYEVRMRSAVRAIANDDSIPWSYEIWGPRKANARDHGGSSPVIETGKNTNSTGSFSHYSIAASITDLCLSNDLKMAGTLT